MTIPATNIVETKISMAMAVKIRTVDIQAKNGLSFTFHNDIQSRRK